MDEMKKEKNSADKDMQGKPQEKRSARTQKGTKQMESVHLPFLLELTYTFSTLILVLLGLTIMITSLLAGAGLFAVILRTAVAVTVIGALLMLIASQVSSGLLFSVKIEQEEEQKKQEEAAALMNNAEDLEKVEV
jgi:predicted RND superfamily exporter protein